ncbi:component of IIS longevity pathway SMK-1-domain-containing protein [Hygrophoropsis aurantiaca]|uniref:Component of IIS longevity pathway SMK-1-domain-containing protein n=1 Tax=Hygrophoropsis aurantiaca TaxID=72124 RepID=A0ACB8AWH2_9AGAM|nr:component of IIS longevity pathway SMK-1-domain-containing protein [Hygrophoropsis aurantiaca]
MNGVDTAPSSPPLTSIVSDNISQDSLSATQHSLLPSEHNPDPLHVDLTALPGSVNSLEGHTVDPVQLRNPHDTLTPDLQHVGDEGKEEHIMLEAVDPTATQEESQDLLPESDQELKRVKVYELIGSRWVDQGTAFCFGQFQDETNEAFLIARAEANYANIILSTAIRSNDVYQRQQDTLIVWTEPDGVDYALSFQDPEGCAEVWNFIIEVQRHMNSGGEPASPLTLCDSNFVNVSCLKSLTPGFSLEDQTAIGSSSPGADHSVTTATIIRTGHLPSPQLGFISDIERAIKALARGQTVKEKICEYIQREEYIKSLIEVMNMAEDLESLDNLHSLCSLMQTILLMNDHGIYEHILDDDIFFGVVGMLEYDPEFPTHKANYREFLHLTSQFHQPIPIQDEAIQKKVHHTYRLQFLKDVVLARALDDSTFNVLNSCIIFNQIDIINHVQQDAVFLREIVGLFVSEEILSGGIKEKASEATKVEGDKMDVDAKVGTPIKSNGDIPNGQCSRLPPFSFGPPDNLSDQEVTLRKEVIILIQQLCVMGKNVQLPARMALFRSLVDRGILFAAQWALALPEKLDSNLPMISAAGEIVAAILDHDLNGVRGHVWKQSSAIQREMEAGRDGVDKADTLLKLMCRIMVQSRQIAVQSQIGDALKALLEIASTDGPETPATVGAKLLGRPKDDPGTEKFMDYFYKSCIDILFKPFTDIPEFKKLSGPILKLSREKTNLYLYLCDLLCNFVQQHAFRIHFYILASNISARVATLLSVRDKHLRLAAFRFFRVCLKINNRNVMNHFIKLEVLKPILDLTTQESRRDTLLSASCQEFFDHMRRELIHQCMTKYEESIRKLAETPLGGPRFASLITRWEMNLEPPPKEESQPDIDARDPRRLGRNIDIEEEDYFNGDDDEAETMPYITAPHLRGRPSSPGDLKRKRRGALVASKGFRPTTVVLPKVHPLPSLVDYGEDEEEEIGPPPPESPPHTTPQAVTQDTSPNASVSPSAGIPLSPRLSHRQIPPRPPLPSRRPSTEDDEDNLLESLLRKSGPQTSSIPLSKTLSKPPMAPIRLAEKRRREEDDDDELLARVASKAKRSDLGAQKEDSQLGGRVAPTKTGDDPPKKIKLMLRSGSTPRSTSFTPVPSEVGAKDGDTG